MSQSYREEEEGGKKGCKTKISLHSTQSIGSQDVLVKIGKIKPPFWWNNVYARKKHLQKFSNVWIKPNTSIALPCYSAIVLFTRSSLELSREFILHCLQFKGALNFPVLPTESISHYLAFVNKNNKNPFLFRRVFLSNFYHADTLKLGEVNSNIKNCNTSFFTILPKAPTNYLVYQSCVSARQKVICRQVFEMESSEFHIPTACENSALTRSHLLLGWFWTTQGSGSLNKAFHTFLRDLVDSFYNHVRSTQKKKLTNVNIHVFF